MFDIEYLILAIFVLGMNTIPFFMPPTWVVLAFFYTQFNLELVPTVLIGATMATTGRVILYYLAKSYLGKFLPKSFKTNFLSLGQFFKKRERLTIPLVLTYAFLPIPSNDVFIVAGLAQLKIKIIAFSFLIGRLISYTFWVSLANKVGDKLEILFENHFSNFNAFAIELFGVLVILLIGKINWRKVLKI